MNKEKAALLLGCQANASCEDILQAYNLQRAIIFAKYDPDPIQKAKYDAALENLELAFRILCPDDNLIPSPEPKPLPAPILVIDQKTLLKIPEESKKTPTNVIRPTLKFDSLLKLIPMVTFFLGMVSLLILQEFFSGKADKEATGSRISITKTPVSSNNNDTERSIGIENIEIIQGKHGITFDVSIKTILYKGQPFRLTVFIYDAEPKPDYKNVKSKIEKYSGRNGQLEISIDLEPSSDLYEEKYPIYIPYDTILLPSGINKLKCYIQIEKANTYYGILAKSWCDFTLSW